MKHLKEHIKYLLRRYAGYDIRSIRIKLEEDFIDQKKLLAGTAVKTIFDVGANVGQTTSKYKKMFPKADIYGFEPYPEIFERYVRHFRGDKRVHPVGAALSDKEGSADFFVNSHHYTNSLLPINREADNFLANFQSIMRIDVRTETIDLFCLSRDIKHINILKLDVQGGELLVLKGCTGMLSKKSVDLIYTEIEFAELYEHQPMFEDLKNFLEPYGYTLFKNYNTSYTEKHIPLSGDAIFTSPDIIYRT